MSLERIKQLSEDYFPELQQIRHHLHQYPELSFQENETAAYVISKLKESGIHDIKKIGGTGVIALIRGEAGEGKTVALRADLDALPISEQNDVPYKSKKEGLMHACGHDVHTTCLLGAAKILHELRSGFSGTIKLVFQPGEEKIPGGASVLIKEGVLTNPVPVAIIAQHVFPALPAGKVGFRNGSYMASADELYITVKGKGGHAAMPHTVIDPVLISSHLIIALQQLASRFIPPSIPAVLSIGKVLAEGATNIIPTEVKMEGTFRVFNEEWRAKAHDKIEEICTHLTRSMGGSCELEIRKGYPVLVNNDELTNRCREYAGEFLGNENITELEQSATAEDFAWYTQHLPGCFFRLGTGNVQKGITAAVHSPHFDIDEEALKTGAGLLAFMALKELNFEK